MNITLRPTGRFEVVDQGSGRVQCRIWEGTAENGAPVMAHIPVIGVRTDATPEQQAVFERELREVKAERQLVAFDMRMVL